MVQVEFDPGETVVAEAGAMTYMQEGISFDSRMGDGSEPESVPYRRVDLHDPFYESGSRDAAR